MRCFHGLVLHFINWLMGLVQIRVFIITLTAVYQIELHGHGQKYYYMWSKYEHVAYTVNDISKLKPLLYTNLFGLHNFCGKNLDKGYAYKMTSLTYRFLNPDMVQEIWSAEIFFQVYI